MSTRERAEVFARYVGLELKGSITAQGQTAQAVAQASGRSVSAFNRWLNGKSELPLAALCESCEIIGVDPQEVVDRAYNRMVVSMGEADGTTYDDASVAAVRAETALLSAESATVHRLRPMSPSADTLLAAHDDDSLVEEIESQIDEP